MEEIVLIDVLKKHKVFVLYGMFGCGKTELAINMALELSKKDNVALADIDTISPYFRSRDEKTNLEKQGITVITPPPHLMYADLPIIVPQVGGYIQNPKYKVVIDVGGNEDGATVLSSINNFLKDQNYVGIFVVNKYRPFSDNADVVVKNIEMLSKISRTKIDYMINNTNMSSETTFEMIKKGEEMVDEVRRKTGVKVLCSIVPDFLEEGLNNENFNYPLFTLKRFLKPIWED